MSESCTWKRMPVGIAVEARRQPHTSRIQEEGLFVKHSDLQVCADQWFLLSHSLSLGCGRHSKWRSQVQPWQGRDRICPVTEVYRSGTGWGKDFATFD